MPFREFHYRWEFDLESSPEQLWPLVADTNRFNRDTGVPAIENLSNPGAALRNARRRLRLSAFGIPVEWEEQPFEWVRPARFGVVRRYSKGPIEELRVLAELIPTEKRRGASNPDWPVERAKLCPNFSGIRRTSQRRAIHASLTLPGSTGSRRPRAATYAQ